MLVAVTKIVEGEKNGKKWTLIHFIDPKTGETGSKFLKSTVETNSNMVNDLSKAGLELVDVLFDSRGQVDRIEI